MLIRPVSGTTQGKSPVSSKCPTSWTDLASETRTVIPTFPTCGPDSSSACFPSEPSSVLLSLRPLRMELVGAYRYPYGA